MTCSRIQQLVSKQIDGPLPERQRAALELHLEGCQRCREYRDRFDRSASDLAGFAALPHPTGMAARSISLWMNRPQVVQRHLPVRTPAFAAVGFACLLAIVFGRIVFLRSNYPVTRVARDPYRAAVNSYSKRDDNSIRAIPASPQHLADLGTDRPPAGSKKPHSRLGELTPAVHAGPAPIGDLAYVNVNELEAVRRWTQIQLSETDRIRDRIDRLISSGDDFVEVPFPQIAGRDDRATRAAVAAYQTEKEIVDPRLSRKVSLAVKGMAFIDLCKKLSEDSGIAFTAGRTVANDKVTIFCKEKPLRDLMRAISQLFAFGWIRSGDPSAYRYELMQGMRAQLMEEELRNRDRNEALLALDRNMENLRGLLDLSPAEAAEKSKSATGEEKQMLEKLAGCGWGAAQLYFRLSPDELGALRGGGELRFGGSQEGGRPLPTELANGILGAMDRIGVRIQLNPDGSLRAMGNGIQEGQPPSSTPGANPTANLSLRRNELGQYSLDGSTGVSLGGGAISQGRDLASGMSPSVQNPENAKSNAKLARDPSLRLEANIKPEPSCTLPGNSWWMGNAELGAGEPRVTTADVLEAIHNNTGRDIIGDYFTKLIMPDRVTVAHSSLFDALNRISDAMRVKWAKSDVWLQFRSAAFFNDRLKEVPGQLLTRWQAARRLQGYMPVDELVEIAQLTDAQLDSEAMAEGARAIYGLLEWQLARDTFLRKDWRFLADIPGAVRRAAFDAKGIAIGRLPLSGQERFATLAMGGRADQMHAEDLAVATMRVEYRPLDSKAESSDSSARPSNTSRPAARPNVSFIFSYGSSQGGYWTVERSLNRMSNRRNDGIGSISEEESRSSRGGRL